MSTDAAESLEQYARHEEALSELYDAYARCFPDHAEFWNALSKEEKEHSEIFRDLGERVLSGEVVVDPAKFPADGVQWSRSYVQHRIYAAKSDRESMLGLLSVAIELERDLIESVIFEVIESYPERLKTTLTSQSEDIQRHLEMLEEMWKKTLLSGTVS